MLKGINFFFIILLDIFSTKYFVEKIFKGFKHLSHNKISTYINGCLPKYL